MGTKTRRIAFASFVMAGAFASQANAEVFVRWTGATDPNADLDHIVTTLAQKTGLAIKPSDFVKGESRSLAYTNYQRFGQTIADVAVEDRSIRIWTDPKTGQLIQMEASLDDPKDYDEGVVEHDDVAFALTEDRAMDLVTAALERSSDPAVMDMKTKDVWREGRYVRIVTVTAKRGVHEFVLDHLSGALVHSRYIEHPQADGATEFSLATQVYPVYEEFEGQQLTREPATLRYLKASLLRPENDPYASLSTRRYFAKKHDAVRGITEEGQAEGYWSLAHLAETLDGLERQIPTYDNSFASGGVILEGRYATVDIHPDAHAKFGDAALEWRHSSRLLASWRRDDEAKDYELIFKTAYLGKPITSAEEAMAITATRDPDHNPVTYMNEGFDEIQVYYSINQLFDALRPLGFIDPDLAERPFHAYLFNPDITMRDNAYYTNDTINFTTYSPGEPNYARDNLTIWHELGHGVMDRLMGEELELADTGGLSEGMADFVAEMVLKAVRGDAPFAGDQARRIQNAIGFHLTNEVHDDGEAYGGVMKAILDEARSKWGAQGLHKVADLVLEAMRFSRDHPHLTAEDWFERMKFADQLGRDGVRAPGELHDLIEAALRSRNFTAEAERARFDLTYDGKAVVAGEDGSRGHDFKAELKPEETKEYELVVRLADGAATKYAYPVTVRVTYDEGALQGAVDWLGEDKGAKEVRIDRPGEDVTIPVAVSGRCDYANRDDGSCSDYAYLQVVNDGESMPVAKKRFYVRVVAPKDPS